MADSDEYHHHDAETFFYILAALPIGTTMQCIQVTRLTPLVSENVPSFMSWLSVSQDGVMFVFSTYFCLNWSNQNLLILDKYLNFLGQSTNSACFLTRLTVWCWRHNKTLKKSWLCCNTKPDLSG